MIGYYCWIKKIVHQVGCKISILYHDARSKIHQRMEESSWGYRRMEGAFWWRWGPRRFYSAKHGDIGRKWKWLRHGWSCWFVNMEIIFGCTNAVIYWSTVHLWSKVCVLNLFDLVVQYSMNCCVSEPVGETVSRTARHCLHKSGASSILLWMEWRKKREVRSDS
jgi:hypothetical protein